MRWDSMILIVAFPSAALAQVQVTTEPAHRGTLPRTVTAYGVMQAAPGGSQTVSVLRAGQVMQVDVRPGEAVKQGQRLLVIVAEPAALAAYRQATSALTLARSERSHAAQLLADHLGTRDQLAMADKAVTDAQSALDTLDREGGGTARQPLTAGFDGIVSTVLVAPGARVAGQTPLLTIDRANQLLAAVGVEPARRSGLAAAQPAKIEPLYDGVPVAGHVLSVGAILDPPTRLVGVLISPDAPNTLLPGSPVKATIDVGQMIGWTVPRNAVLSDAKGAYLFQVDGDKAHRVDVKIVGRQGGTTVVDGALGPERALITAGNYQLQDGAAIRPAPDGKVKPP